MSIIGIFILLLACINYVNLTTARSVIRTKEVAIKRVIGSSITLVRFQLILESIIVSVVSLFVALTATQIFITKFNNVAMVDIRIAEWNRPDVWAIIFSAIVVLGIAAGVYPAFYLTGVKPVALMKGAALQNATTFSFRSLLMTFQFALSVVMIVCALANLRQMNYVRSANLGFNKEQILQIATPADFEQEYALRETFKEALLESPDILGVSFSSGGPGGEINTIPMFVDDNKQILEFFLVDHDYFEVMNIELWKEEVFREKILVILAHSRELPDNVDIMVNESAVREFGLTSPIGKKLYYEEHNIRYAAEIIGVIKDFHLRSFHHKISPFIFIQTNRCLSPI